MKSLTPSSIATSGNDTENTRANVAPTSVRGNVIARLRSIRRPRLLALMGSLLLAAGVFAASSPATRQKLLGAKAVDAVGSVKRPSPSAANFARALEGFTGGSSFGQEEQSLQSATQQPGPSLWTDRADYEPGETANITGNGFQVGEAVSLQILHADGTPTTGDDHATWTVPADAQGGFQTTWHVCTDDCRGSHLELTAKGLSSGLTVQAVFTDSAPGPKRFLYTGGHGLNSAKLTTYGGHTYATIGASDAAWTTALSGGYGAFDAFVVGEGTPVPSASTRAAIASYVLGGGRIIVISGHGSSETAFLNNVFGYSTVVSQGCLFNETVAGSLQAGAAGTTFAGGPSTLRDLSCTTHFTIASRPASAILMYANATTDLAWVKQSGAGIVVWLGWDYCCGTDSYQNDWYRVLDSSLHVEVNQPPVAANSNITTNEDTAVADTLSATDPNGNTLTYTVVSGPSHGTLSGTAPNLTYTPAANYNGADSFTYKANDGTADSNVATVSITVTPVNDPPAANNDSYSGSAGSIITLAAPGVLANDTDVDGDALTAVLVANAAHGTVTLNADGSFSYFPSANYSGLDSFTYQAKDAANALSNVATVSITINKLNQTITFGALANRTYGDAPFTLAATASSGLPVSFQIISGPATVSGSTLTLTGAGTITVRASQAGNAIYNAAPNVDQSFSVAKATPTLSATGGTFTYDGLPHPATGTVTGVGGASLGAPAFTYVDLNGNSSLSAPVNVSVYNVNASFAGDANYNPVSQANAATVTILSDTCLALNALSGAGSWATKAPMPTPHGGAASAVLNGQLYVATGFSSSGATQAVEAYDPATNVWTTKAPIPTARPYAGAATINGKLYVVGGCTNNGDCRIGTTNLLEIYNSATNTWTTGAPMQTARHAFAIGAIGGKLYVAGGRQACPSCNNAVTTEVYDPATNTWTTKATMPTVRHSAASAVVNGQLYVVGGSPGLSGVSGAVEAYDPATNVWTAKASMLTPRQALGADAANGLLYAISGLTAASSVTNIVEAYNPATNTWSARAPIPTARYGVQPGTINGKLYVAGSGSGNSAISTLEAYTPSIGAPVAWYPGDGNANDIIGGNNGTLQDGAAFAAGEVGQAFSFDGVNAHVGAPDSASLRITDAITIDAWINPGSVSQAQGAGIVAKGSFRDGAYAIDIINPGTLRFFFYQGDLGVYQVLKVGWLTPAKLNMWSHIAATFDSATGVLNLYDNGALVASSNAPAGTKIGVNNHELSIGSRQNGGSGGGEGTYDLTFAGLVDEVEIFNRALSAQEVQSLYLADSHGTCQPPATTTSVQNLSTAFSPSPQNLTLSAAVTTPSGTVNSGAVQFTVKTAGGATVGSPVTANVSSGSASAGFTLPGGTSPQTLTVSAVYTTSALDFQSTAGAGTLTINKTTPTITWANPADITYGTALGAAQLSATANVPGSLTYTPAAGTMLGAGNAQTLSVSLTPADAANYDTATKTVSINVNPAVLTVKADDKSKTYGQANPALTSTITGFVNGDAASVVNGAPALSTTATGSSGAGSYPIIAALGTLSAANYTFAFAPGTLTVNKATATINVTALPAVYDALPHAATATATGVNGEDLGAVTISYSPGGSAAPVNAGSYGVVASFAGDVNYNAASDNSAVITITKATPSLSVGGGTFTYDGTSHGASASATGVGGAAVTGTPAFTYAPGGTAAPVNAGDYTVSASFTSGDPNYTDATGTGAITITKANATISVTPYSVTYDGNPHTATGTATGVGGASLSGLDLSATTHTDAGAYNSDAWTFTDGAGNYNNVAGTVNDSIAQATSTVTVSCTASQTYTGASIAPCMATATGAGSLNVPLTVNYTNNTDAGTATASAIYAGDANHTASTGNGGFAITKAPSATALTFESGPYVYRGSAFTATAAVTGAGSLNQPVSSVAYSGDCTNVSSADGCTATATYLGDANHEGSTDSKSITITQASAGITVNPYTGVYDGNAHRATGSASGVNSADLNSLLDLGASFTNVPGGTAHWTFAGNTNYAPSSGDVAVAITQAEAVIAVSGYSDVYDGNAHGATGSATGVKAESLNNLLHLGDSFTNAPGGTARWTFDGDGNYKATSGDATITISKATPVISWSNPADIVYGTMLGATQLNASVSGLSGGSAPGALTYAPPAGTVLSAGNAQALKVDAAATQNYKAASKTVHLDVAKATPVVNWNTPAAITYGTALSAMQLNATAAHPTVSGPLSGTAVAGAFAYTPAAGAVLPVGNNTLTVTFTPTDAADYTTATKSVIQRVNYGVCALYDQTKAAKSGSIIPVKLQLCNAAGANQSSSSIVVHAIGTRLVSPNAWGAVEDAGNANPDMDFRFTMFDPSTGGYIFNLQTKGLTTGTYQLSFTVGGDPAIYTVQFQIR